MQFKTTALLAILSALTSIQASCSYDGGNYYCSETKKVVYKGIGFEGTYQDVTNMDESSGTCSQQSYSFSGNLSPLDEELSVHFRGPIRLLQFGVYYPSSSSNNKKREVADEDCSPRHVHHKHKKRATEVVQVTQTVFVDSNGNTVTSEAVETETPTTEAQTQADTEPETQAQANTETFGQISALQGEGKAYRTDISTSAAPTTTSSQASDSSETVAADGAWTRDSYYTPGSTDNCVFLNYHGGSGSGVWSAAFGNSLSYANSDNSGGSSTPVALSDVTLGSNKEFVIMSGSKCTDGSGCGYYREGTVAHHGFGGSLKIFVFEFEMPTDSGSGFNQDMPAVWLLNAKIPRTLQYGDASCSCWKTGCGELDLFEILSAGSNKLISHLHDGQGASSNTNNGGGGSQDYFARPTSGSFKGVVIFTSDEIHILQVDDNTDFGSSLDEDTVNGWLQESGSVATIGY
ncbi:Protein TOS1 [Candida viswanathii]|uniref:glucan endo-1,3-beta-D-glucosidase n=1 Tax=Candida viswanathii TaxID=5486 RepID=A0A367YPC2_9ASCO|nr:Protein TOS1 [Candida viswanathii]